MLTKRFRLMVVALIATAPVGCGVISPSPQGGVASATKFGNSPLSVVQTAYSDRETQLTEQGYQYGANNARDSRQPDVQTAMNTLGIIDTNEQEAFNHGFLVGYDLEHGGYQHGQDDATSGLQSNAQTWLNRLNIISSTEQQIFRTAYSRGYQQATGTSSGDRQTQVKKQGYQYGADQAQAGLAKNPQDALNRLGFTDPTERQIFTNAFYKGYDLARTGYQYGQNDAHTGRQPNAQNWLNTLGITDPIERQVFRDAFSRGYQQVGAGPSRDRQAELRAQGYDYGAQQARQRQQPNPTPVLNRLGITNPTERQIFSDAFTRGFYLENQGYKYGQDVALANRQPDTEEGLNGLGITDPTERDIFADAFERGYRSKCRRGAGICALW